MKHRIHIWLLLSIVLAAVVYLGAPADPLEAGPWSRFLVIVHKINLITWAGWVGYWLDRALFPYGRPDRWKPEASMTDYELWSYTTIFNTCMLRRAIVMAACMLAIGMGL